MDAKKQTEGHAAQGAGLGVGRAARKGSRGFSSASMTEGESEERWDRLLASPKSQSLLKKMAAEAREEDRAGLTKDLEIDEL